MNESLQVAVNRLIEARDRLTDVETVVATWVDNAAKRATLRQLSDAFDAVDTLMLNLKNPR
jgi:hypothetical protein